MIVTLNKADLYDESGPQAGDEGVAVEIREIDGDLLAAVVFRDHRHEGFFWVKVEHLLHLRTENTESYRSTLP